MESTNAEESTIIVSAIRRGPGDNFFGTPVVESRQCVKLRCDPGEPRPGLFR